MRILSTGWIAWIVALAAGASPPPARAKQLSATKIFIEVNATDRDAGLHLFLDGAGWSQMRVLDPEDRVILDITAQGSVGLQGVTELFFESAEPSFDEQPLEDFLARFPAGIYRYQGTTIDGRPLKGKARLTHALPEGPELVAPLDGDDSVDPLDTVIEWNPVPDPPGSSIVGYQVLVLREQPSLLVFSADVGPNITSVTVPAEFMLPRTAYKYEVLAIEESGNQTLSEAEFETE
jgi:hypothetical protein